MKRRATAWPVVAAALARERRYAGDQCHRLPINTAVWLYLSPLIRFTVESESPAGNAGAARNMNEPGKPPVSKASKRPDGSWCADVLWHNGRREQIGRFKTAIEAEDFIKGQLQAWHEVPKAVGKDRALGWGRYSPSSGL